MLFRSICSSSFAINLGEVLEKAARDYVKKNPEVQPKPATEKPAPANPENAGVISNLNPNSPGDSASDIVLGNPYRNRHRGGRGGYKQPKIHAVQIFRPTGGGKRFRRRGETPIVAITVQGNRPGYLFLSSRDRAYWVISGKTELVQGVHLHGVNRSEVEGVDPRIVDYDSYVPYDNYIPERAPAYSDEPGEALLKYSGESGLAIGSVQGEWESNSFVVYTGN